MNEATSHNWQIHNIQLKGMVRSSTSRLTNLTSNLATKNKTNLALVHQFLIANVQVLKSITEQLLRVSKTKRMILSPLPLQLPLYHLNWNWNGLTYFHKIFSYNILLESAYQFVSCLICTDRQRDRESSLNRCSVWMLMSPQNCYVHRGLHIRYKNLCVRMK